jgi:CrcB protein
MTPLVVGAGGAIGALARYYVSDWMRLALGESMPWGTFTVNVLGSFALGFLLVWLQAFAPNDQLRQFAAIGVLGSFTTFSTFSYETVTLARAGEITRAASYAAGSIVVGIIAVVAGIGLATFLTSARA